MNNISNRSLHQSRIDNRQNLLVSIIIPVYNSAEYITIAIESILAQTYGYYEIIAIDDGSTDDTRQKLESYGDRLRYVFQRNQGSAAARNAGIKLSRGELIAFLDADDFWLMPTKLERQVSCLQNDPGLGGLNTGWQIVDSAGRHLKSVQPWHKAPQLDLETWLKKKCVRTSAMIFRREWLERVNGFDIELKQSHDVDLVLRLALAGCKIGWLKEETVCYRQHSNNTTKDSLKQAKYVSAVLDKFFARRDLPTLIARQEHQVRYHTLVWIAWYQYRANSLRQMSEFLDKSLSYSPYLLVENISHWLNTFERLSQERGEEFDTDLVTNSREWQQLIVNVLSRSPTLPQQMNPNQVRSVPFPLTTATPSKHSEITKPMTERSSQFTVLDAKIDSATVLDRTKSNKSVVASKSVSLAQQSATEYASLGDRLFAQQKYDAAIDAFTQAVNLVPEAWREHRKLGKAYRQLGDLEQSLNCFQRSIQIKSDIGEIHTDCGQTLAQLGRWSEAIACFTKGLEINPKQPWAYYKLANLQEKQHDFDAAVSSLQQAIAYDPNNSLFHRNLAQVQQVLGNLDESIAAYRQAIRHNPDLELTVYRNLGQAIQHNATVKPRLGLKGLARKLRSRAGKIAYLGASPTAQDGGYVPLLQAKLEEYFQQPHYKIEAGNGGITANAAVFTMDREILALEPDFCFIEYSSADMGKGYSTIQAVEGMVKKLLAANCQVCLLYMYKRGFEFNGSDPVLAEYEKVAEFYGIPSINVGKHVERLLADDEYTAAELFSGRSKTTPAGSEAIAQFIFSGLKEMFQVARHTAVNSFNQHQNQARYLNANHYGRGQIVTLDESAIVDRHNYQTGKFQDYQFYQIDSQNQIQFTIEGELVGITTIVGLDSGIIELEAEGQTKEYQLWDAYCFSDRYQALIVQRHFARPTVVTIRPTDKPVDYSECIKKIEHPADIKKSLRVVGLLVCGTIT